MSLELDTADTLPPPTLRLTGLVLDVPGHPYDGPAEPLLSTLRAGVAVPLAFEQPTGPVLDQAANDCVANAFADAIRDRQAMQGVEHPRLPGRPWIYWLARKLAGREMLDDGSQPSLAIRAIREYGMPAEEHCPYVDAAGEPPLSAAQHAYDQRGRVSARTLDPDDVRHALASDLAVVVAIQVDDAFERLGPDAPSWVFGGGRLGLHALRVVGYDHMRGLRLKNSWGTGWGEDGFAWMAWDALSDGSVLGLWVIEWAPSYSEDIPAEVRS